MLFYLVMLWIKCSSCSRDAVREQVQRYLKSSIQHQQHVSELVIRQFNDAFLDQCIDSVTIYDLSAVIQVSTMQYHHNISAAVSVWNSLLESVQASPLLPVFHGRLNTELFARSYWQGPLTVHWLLPVSYVIVTRLCSRSQFIHHHHQKIHHCDHEQFLPAQ